MVELLPTKLTQVLEMSSALLSCSHTPSGLDTQVPAGAASQAPPLPLAHRRDLHSALPAKDTVPFSHY